MLSTSKPNIPIPVPLLKKQEAALAGVAQWIEYWLRTKGSRVRVPVRAQAWVAGQVPSGAMGKATTH